MIPPDGPPGHLESIAPWSGSCVTKALCGAGRPRRGSNSPWSTSAKRIRASGVNVCPLWLAAPMGAPGAATLVVAPPYRPGGQIGKGTRPGFAGPLGATRGVGSNPTRGTNCKYAVCAFLRMSRKFPTKKCKQCLRRLPFDSRN